MAKTREFDNKHGQKATFAREKEEIVRAMSEMTKDEQAKVFERMHPKISERMISTVMERFIHMTAEERAADPDWRKLREMFISTGDWDYHWDLEGGWGDIHGNK